MKTTFKEVSYFYPTSTCAKRYNLPKGGYCVKTTTGDSRTAKTTYLAGFATETEAMTFAESLPHAWFPSFTLKFAA